MNKKNPTNIQSTDVAVKSTTELEKIIATELEIPDSEKTSAAAMFNQAAPICSPHTDCGVPNDKCEQKTQ